PAPTENSPLSLHDALPIYGLALHYPETLERLDEPASLGGSDFVNQDAVVTLQSFAVTAEMYPNANFGGGSFTVFVNPTVRSEGTDRKSTRLNSSHLVISYA